MPKPLLFGDATFDAKRIEAMRQVESEWDNSYVPGYSEARRDNELRVRDGKKPIAIPRLQWLRVGHLDAKDVGNKDMLEWARLGYQFVTEEDLKSWGFAMPPAAHVAADGRIRREDVALAFVSPEQHAANVARQAQINGEFHAAPSRYRGARGADINVDESTSRRIADISEIANYQNN